MADLDNELKVGAFLHRLGALQRLCAVRRPDDPSALLVIPGLDGRNNKESATLLKYLFGGVVGRELLNNSGIDDALEEMVLLIQETSVSVVYTPSAKKICGPLLSNCPFLIEYMSSLEEEEEIDLMQARKVSDFKQMMMESVPSGSTVGMSIPIGYESVLDVESWPLLQSFALDSVVCPTGFFTARYTVADMSEMLSIVYRTVDEYSVDNAIAVLRKSILPHIMQTISMLDGPTGSQRAHVTAGDAVGPLEMLYEFGEMECASFSQASGTGLGSGATVSPLDPAHRPVLLFGAHTSAVGAVGGRYPKGWQGTPAGESLHTVVEGCEPSTGIRFCRSYFLRRGKSLPFLKDAEALVGADEEDEGQWIDDNAHKRSATHASGVSEATAVATLERLEGLYVKLWLGLRATVLAAFKSHVDVLEAGTYVQRTMDAFMKGKLDAEAAAAVGAVADLPGLGAVRLRAGERLQVHMDCLNALGEVVSVEDVDDMGGSCWCYIRVSAHGVGMAGAGGSEKETSAVAVGDTFLFSVGKKLIADRPPPPTASLALPLLVADSVCLTHAIPYYRCLLGQGDEEKSTQRFLACTRSPHMLQALGLGDPIDVSSSSVNRGFNAGSLRAGGGSAALLSSVPTLTDHPLTPLLATDVRLFSAGLVVERAHTAALPMLICMEQHVAEMWTVDGSECLSLAQALGLVQTASEEVPEPSVPEGLLVVLRLKQFEEVPLGEGMVEAGRQEGKENRSNEGKHDEEEEDEEEEEGGGYGKARVVDDVVVSSMRRAMMFNPLQRAMSNLCVGPVNSSGSGSGSGSGSNSGSGSDSGSGSQCIALFAPMGTRVFAAISTALVSWRRALRAQDVPEHRGGAGKRPRGGPGGPEGTPEGGLPVGILRAFVIALDAWSIAPADISGPGSMLGMGLGGSTGSSGLRLTSSGQMGMDDLVYDESVPVSCATILGAAAAAVARGGLPGSGFLAMRCTHAYSEAIRLRLPHYGVQTFTETADRSALSGAGGGQRAQGVRLVVLTGQAGSGVGILADHICTRLEQGGAVVSSVAVDLAAATATATAPHDARRGESKSAGDKSDGEGADAQACQAAVTRAIDSAFTAEKLRVDARGNAVVVVSVILASRVHLRQPDLYALLTKAAAAAAKCASATVAIRLAVVSAKTAAAAVLGTPVNPRPLASESTQGAPTGYLLVGVEAWRGAGLEVCQRGVCDLAVVVDATASTAGDAYYSFRNWLQQVNPDAMIARVHPTSLRLDEEPMDLVMSCLDPASARTRAENLIAHTHARATFAFRYAPLSLPSASDGRDAKFRLSCRPVVGGGQAGLTALQLTLPSHTTTVGSGSAMWSVPSLLTVLQFIFPHASVSCPAAYADDRWNPPPSGAAGFRRAVELARAKVFSARRAAQEKQGVVDLLSALRKQSSSVDALRAGMLSLHGTLVVCSAAIGGASEDRGQASGSGSGSGSGPAPSSSSGGKVWITLEAHAGAVLVRACGAPVNGGDGGREGWPLTVQGSFTGGSDALLHQLAAACAQHPLRTKPPITRGALAARDILLAQVKYCGKNHTKRPLPGGWWFDGNVYLDVNGNQRPYRPDIEDILDEHLAVLNREVTAYNEFVGLLQESM